jgi:uncharacterized protein (DUF1778 family)
MATITIKKTKASAARSVKRRSTVAEFTPEIQLSARDSQIVLDALQSPPKPNRKLKRAAARFKKLTAKKP